MFEIREDDRVLLLSMPAIAVIESLARSLTHGLIVVLGSDEAVRAGRRALDSLENVMFVPAPPHDIPWRGEFFTRVIDAACEWERPARVLEEISRVLSPDGLARLGRRPDEIPPSLEIIESDDGSVVLRRLFERSDRT